MSRWSTGRLMAATTATVATMVSAAGCSVVDRDVPETAGKPAIRAAEAASLVEQYDIARSRADASLDADQLAELEAGALLRIDRGLYFQQRELGLATTPVQLDQTTSLIAGSFEEYPLWFVTVNKLVDSQEQVAAVFVRRTSTAPWLVTEAPRLAQSTELGRPEVASDGSAIVFDPVTGRWSDGTTVERGFAQQLIDDYAAMLTDPGAPGAEQFAADSFVEQMRQLAQAQPGGVDFRQQWQADTVRHVVRLSDGGVLIFATLVRTDQYTVQPRSSLDFAELPASAYLPKPLRASARLDYRHQVLMLVPSSGKPLVIGQHGGLIGAAGS